MATLTNIEVGSVVLGIVDNVPAGIIGLITTIVNQNCYYAGLITGDSVSPDAISTSYQPGIISLTIGNVLGLMSAQGIGTQSVKIGELSIAKGMSISSAQEWKELGISQLKEGGEKVSYYQTYT